MATRSTARKASPATRTSDRQWIVDPIDGTVNYFYGIPHFCVSIALRVAGEITVGVIHDPMVGETWTVEKGSPAMLNGKPISASKRETLGESILYVGCGKDEDALRTGIDRFHKASLRARKMRMMGSAALGMAYIASGRHRRLHRVPHLPLGHRRRPTARRNRRRQSRTDTRPRLRRRLLHRRH